MGATNHGNQDITYNYYEEATAEDFNKRHLSIRLRGVYEGGYLTKVNDSEITLSPFTLEIGDDSEQISSKSSENAILNSGTLDSGSISSATPYIMFRWAFAETVANFVEIHAIASLVSAQDNDIVVGKCLFSGSTLTGFSYSDRTFLNVQDIYLRVEATSETEMYVRVRNGRTQTRSEYIFIPEQKVGPFAVPGASNSRIDLVYVNKNTGAIEIETGVADPSPSASDYSGKLVLAEVTTVNGDSNISADRIKDVRNFLSHDEMYQDRGDFVTEDFKLSVPGSLGQLTADGAWHEADFSPVIPAGARAGIFKLAIIGTAGQHSIWIKAIDAAVDSANFGLAYAVNDANKMVDFEFTVKLTSSRKIQYRILVGVTHAIISCKAWFI